MVQDRSLGSLISTVMIHIVLLFLGLICLAPMLHILAVSLSDRASATAHLVGLWPLNFNLYNYQRVLEYVQFRQSFIVSVLRVIGGTSISLLVSLLTSYPLSIKGQFPGKNAFRWLLIVSLLFTGGLIPWYISMKNLGLTNNLGLMLYSTIQPFTILMIVNFFRALPPELSEAAEIDGASHWDILFRVYLPVSLPVVATATLLIAVFHWNSWFDGLVLISDARNYPLQTYLQTLLTQTSMATGMQLFTDPLLVKTVSIRSMTAAMIVLTTVPIVLLYPLLQRYFIQGLTLGSVKG